MDTDFYNDMKYIPASHRDPRPSNIRPQWIVLHTAECLERDGMAKAIAAYFARGDTVGGAHFTVDNHEIIQCAAIFANKVNGTSSGSLRLKVGKFSYGSMNDYGIHIEMAGKAAQGPQDWDDQYSRSVLFLTAALVHRLCETTWIPPKWVTDVGLKAGIPGITTHRCVSVAGDVVGGHTDPGPWFPGEKFVEAVRNFMQ